MKKFVYLILVGIYCGFNLYSSDSTVPESEEVGYTPCCFCGPRTYEYEALFIGAGIGYPGYLNAVAGADLKNIVTELSVGLIYPYYKTAQISLSIKESSYKRDAEWYGIVGGYVSRGAFDSPYLGFKASHHERDDNMLYSIGLNYYVESEGLIYPFQIAASLSWIIDYSWPLN